MDYLSNNNKEIEVLEESVSVLLTNDGAVRWICDDVAQSEFG